MTFSALLSAVLAAVPAGAGVHTVPILMYHMLGNAPDDAGDHDCMGKGSCRRRADHCPVPGGGVSGPGMVVAYDEFKWQMEYLRSHGWRGRTLDEIFSARPDLRPRDVVITFDDGYADNFEAFGLLREHEMKAVLFMVSDNADCQGRLSAEQLREMDAGGFRVEDHSKTHNDRFTLGTEAEQTEEYGASKKALEALLGRPVEFAAYPYGKYNVATPAVMRSLGYKASFIIGGRVADVDGDRQLVPRFRVSDRAGFLYALCEGLSAAAGKKASNCAAP
ncbi:MAG: polysaccharide deacetylase family protein [Elusimicrobia bacterium]|nr:polysaccharide deacetylase family protein [Elusimicrobiota bacterium]